MAFQQVMREQPSHTPGTPRGEEVGKSVDRFEDDATGINVATRKPIDPRMPIFPPA